MSTTTTPDVAHWYSGVVLRGDQMGRTLGFPSANFDPTILAAVNKEGVYASRVKLGDTEHLGALYIGPRLVLHETKRVLEIHIIDFKDEIYGKTVIFTVETFIRPPMDFDSTDALITRLQQDIHDVSASYAHKV